MNTIYEVPVTDDELLRMNLAGWPVPDKFLLEVGRLAVIWGTLEGLLRTCIGKLAGFDDLHDMKPFILLNHASFPQQLDMLSTLCEQLLQQYPHLAEYKDVVSKIRQAQKPRNQYLHGGMSFNEAKNRVEMARGTARGTLKLAVTEVGVADIRRATAATHLATLALYKLVLERDLTPIWVNRDSK